MDAREISSTEFADILLSLIVLSKKFGKNSTYFDFSLEKKYAQLIEYANIFRFVIRRDNVVTDQQTCCKILH